MLDLYDIIYVTSVGWSCCVNYNTMYEYSISRWMSMFSLIKMHLNETPWDVIERILSFSPGFSLHGVKIPWCCNLQNVIFGGQIQWKPLLLSFFIHFYPYYTYFYVFERLCDDFSKFAYVFIIFSQFLVWNWTKLTIKNVARLSLAGVFFNIFWNGLLEKSHKLEHLTTYIMKMLTWSVQWVK